MSITNFHIDLTQLPSEEHLKYLQKLPKHQKSRVLAALAGPEDQIKTTLLNDKIAQPGRVLTKEELFIALQDCYHSICLNRFEVAYAIAIVGAVTDRASTRSKWAQEAAEQVIFLAARLIKGEGCEDHSDYESPSRMWAGVHEDFADAIANLEDVGRKQGDWIYSDKARFCLGKLSSSYPSQYLLIQRLALPEMARPPTSFKKNWTKCGATTMRTAKTVVVGTMVISHGRDMQSLVPYTLCRCYQD